MAARSANTRNRAPTVLPPDVRLMNAAALILSALAVLLWLAAGVAWLTRAPMFTLRSITLEGEFTRSNLATVRANAVPSLAGNFFSFDLRRGRAAFESVPWVRQAVVRRIWPNRLQVTLEEHHAAALWQGEAGDERLVNSHGEVFEANLGDVEDEGLITLSGPDGSAAAMLTMQRRLTAALAPIASRVETLRLSIRGSWQAELDSGAKIEFGRGSEDMVVARSERFARTLAQATQGFTTAEAPRALLAADLRHADGYALRLRGVSTPASRIAPR